ncbi:MAG: glycosyltransferase [Nitrososphaera sp.]
MTPKTPTVSVCIPTYNRAGMLRESISSVLEQTFQDFELIVSDNASEDETEAVVRSFADKRIAYYRNPHNIGQRPNWNRCLSLASGRYVALFFDDDMMMPENLAEKVAVLEKYPQVGLVHSKYHVVDRHGIVLKFNTNKECAGNCSSDAIEPGLVVLETLLKHNIIHESTVMFRRNCYEQLGGFTDQLSLAFDWEYWMRIASTCDIAFIAKPLVKWRLHSGSLTIVTHQRISKDREAAIARLQSDLSGFRSVGEHYVKKISINARRGVKRQLWRQMGERVAGYALVLLGEGGPNAEVRAFILRMCHAFPEILIEKAVWKAFLKSLLSPRRITQLKRISPT